MRAFIIFRDRVTYGQRCVMALLSAGLDVVVVDQGSTWPPAVDWLRDVATEEHVEVLHRDGGHPRQLWAWPDFLNLCGSDRYVVTDVDVIPSEDCPVDWPAQLGDVLDNYPEYDKAGLGLRLDRIPDTYQRKDHVLAWEKKFWDEPVTEGLYQPSASRPFPVYRAAVDTTLALYQPVPVRPAFSLSGVRTGMPYVADHVAWYEDYRVLDKELRWYHEHAEPGIAHWTVAGRSAWGM